MAVGAPTTKLHLSIAAAARQPSLLHLAAVAVLCSVSYLLGIWHNGGFFAVPSGGAASSVSIATAASVSYVSPTPNVLGGGGGSSSSSAPLNFAAHHTTEGMEAKSTMA